jgi:hypothetical protein
MSMTKSQYITSYGVDPDVYKQFKGVCNKHGLKLSPVVEQLMVWFIKKDKEGALNDAQDTKTV